MRVALTQIVAEKSDRPKSALELRDTRLKGLILRTQPSGIKSYYCEYARGKRIWIGRADAIGITQARDFARSILSDAYRGIDPVDARKAKRAIPTYKQFLEGDYLTWAQANQKAHVQNTRRLHTAFKAILGKRLDQITSLDIERWRAGEIARGLSTNTINRDISSIKASFNRAVDWGLLAASPLGKVKKARIDDCVKVRFLDEKEERALRSALEAREERRRSERESANHWRAERGYIFLPDLREFAFSDHLKPLVLLAINTGTRRGELFDLTWSNVNFERRILTVTGATAKSKRTRHIPLNREALAVLTGWRAQCGPEATLVFENEQGERFDRVNSSWRRLLKDANITEFRWHDMRHHFASKLAMGGVDLNTIRELLGHSDYAMTLRYAHLAPEFKRKAVEVLDRKPFELLKIA